MDKLAQRAAARAFVRQSRSLFGRNGDTDDGMRRVPPPLSR